MMYLRSRDREVYMREKFVKNGYVYMVRIYSCHSGKGNTYGCYTALYLEGILPGVYEEINEEEYLEGVDAILNEIRGVLC